MTESLTNSVFERTRKQAVVASFNVIYRNLSGEVEENQEKLRISDLQVKIETETFRVCGKSINHSAATFGRNYRKKLTARRVIMLHSRTTYVRFGSYKFFL
jgi:hemolysin activation/secretion protein